MQMGRCQLARSNYKSNKRQKELARKKKKELKRQAKLEKNEPQSEENITQTPSEEENPETLNPH
jgi:hypothetical protein